MPNDRRRTKRGPWLRALEGKNDRRVAVRLPNPLVCAFTEAAETHGRGFAEELRVALEVHVTKSMLGVLTDPQIQDRLGAGAKEFERKLRADMNALEATAYARPTPEGLLVPFVDAEAA